ncbi:hypothetical protein bpr_I0892 [Butyrivibrio proteoclasticus B316]|uniref:Uncharacterized protein n=1 Tax=Butyrivibrio proteoclasticus (strain ATCC 51982 / DSM 14932 / B316) TaxID=515622 RepID=E0S1F9_BUTPB|nr:hypothetical protein [Butyrivibrio proteoclasticus]ADL33634.1 hypothetical protein bpr_I0892 [Butyrivibrio proteoclasticus B316]
MADINLKKLSRAELLEMMISFSEEAEAARQHEKELKEELEKEKLQMQHEFADERAAMLKSFDEEKAQMRAKFNEQKAQMQEKFDKDIMGLKARLAREKDELQRQVDDSLMKIENSQSLAEASIQLGGIMESAQKAADLYVNTLKKSAEAEYKELMLYIEKSKLRVQRAEKLQMQAIADKSGKTLEQVRNEAISETSDPEKDKSVEKSEPKKRTTRKKKDE